MTYFTTLTSKPKAMEWAYIIGGLLVVLLVTGIFSGCAVVTTDFSANLKKNATVYYYLPESVIKITARAKVAVVYDENNKLTGSNNLVEQTFTVTPEMIADTRDLLSLNYKSNALMADQIKYGVNTRGLLETVNVTTEDRTADIIAKLAEAPQVIIGTSKGADKDAGKTTVKIKEFTADFAVRASTISSVKQIVGWNLVITNEMGVDEQPLLLHADFKISSDDQPGAPKAVAELLGEKAGVTETTGILTRPLKNMSLRIETALNGTGFNIPLPVNVAVADPGKLIVIPVRRTAFVKQINNVTIQDGIITSNEINKPSSVEGFISIPVNVAKSIVSIPAQLVQFRYDNTKRLDDLEKAKLAYEKSKQESEKFALTNAQEIEKVKLDMQKTDLTNQTELQKLKLELQTSLLSDEQKLLQAQKALDDLKKEIEDLKKK